MHRREIPTESQRREQRETHAGRHSPAPTRLARGEDDTCQGTADPQPLPGRRTVAARDSDDNRHDGGHARDRGDDAHRTHGRPAVEGVETERPRDRRGDCEEGGRVRRALAADRDDGGDGGQTAELYVDEHP